MIQIQHLLKLNCRRYGGRNSNRYIQIQHLLKLNYILATYIGESIEFKYNTC